MVLRKASLPLTPPVYIACGGVFDQNFSKIHDDMYVRCLVLDDGSSKAVLMSFDLLFHDRLLNDAIAALKAKIEERVIHA